MNNLIEKVKKWCESNNFYESNNINSNNMYYIHREGVTEQIDVYWGTTDNNLNSKYNLVIDLNTQTEMVIYQLIDLSEDAYDDNFGNSMCFTHNDYIMGDSCYLKDIDELFNGLRNYIAKMFPDLTAFPQINEN